MCLPPFSFTHQCYVYECVCDYVCQCKYVRVQRQHYVRALWLGAAMSVCQDVVAIDMP